MGHKMHISHTFMIKRAQQKEEAMSNSARKEKQQREALL